MIPERNEPDCVTPPPRSSSAQSLSRKTGRDPVRRISDDQKATIVAKVRVKAAPVRKGPPYISAEVFVFQAGIMKKMHELVSEFSITERRVLGVNRVIRASASKNLPTEKDHVHWFLQGGPCYRVYPLEGGEMEVVLAPREESPNHRSFGVEEVFVMWT